MVELVTGILWLMIWSFVLGWVIGSGKIYKKKYRDEKDI